MNLVEKVKKTIRRYSLLEKGDRIVVGLSGGPDSMALLNVLWSLRDAYDLTLIPAHMNYGMRGKESEEDQGFCEQEAARYGLVLIYESVDLPALILDRGLSPQAAAREIRYDFFRRTAGAHDARRIALGHHADDQAETLLMRLLRGAGTRGLSGMPIRRAPGIIRPLLHVTREEILSYLASIRIPYREDSSNQKGIYLRNRIRRELIPLLVERYNPNLVEDLQRTAEILGEEEAFMQEEAEKRFSPMTIPGGVALDLSDLKGLSHAMVRRMVRMAMVQAGESSEITFRHVDSVLKLMEAEGSAARIDLPEGLKVRKSYERLEFSMENPKESPGDLYEIPVPGSKRIPELRIEVESRVLSLDETADSLLKSEAVLDLDKCSGPLGFRTRRPGDIFYPKGFGKKKKVKRFFIDEKIPYMERGRVPLLVNRENEILWIGGYRMDGRYAVDDKTRRALLIQIRRLNGKEHEETRRSPDIG
ncbi:MAG: tRNA lysidine(34) synthetase TilS [Nitrospirae bacterium CG_4_10_14_3_um_filter_53_41]|nr:MAG: tRNA lysidine(34) synthetase TilS [Nitrospirae bacterium CG_4_10_14_3_um_filter_53_41]